MVPRVIFFGTPAVAGTVLTALAKHYTIVGVITEPDKPAGRGQAVTAPPVKQVATTLGLKVYQPSTKEEIAPLVTDLKPDIGVLVAFGTIIPASVLSMFPLGILNLHGSLLPQYRGASPIQAALLNGDTVTGASIMKLDKGVDTGPVLSRVTVPITATDTTETLLNKVVAAGTAELLKVLPDYLAGTLTPQPQPAAGSYAPKLTKADGQIDWSAEPRAIERQIRAYTPWPRAYTTWRGRQLIIRSAQVINGELIPTSVQLAGKQPTSWADFRNGFHLTSAQALAELKHSIMKGG